MSRTISSVCVFCGAKTGNRSVYTDMARRLGEEIAHRHLTLVYGGGNIGLMGTIARTAFAGGGSVISVIPRSLMQYEGVDTSIGELIVVDTLLERKAIMAEKSDAFITMPGGFGTFDELFEMVTWNQLGVHAKPVGLYNIAGYYDPLLQMIDHAVSEEFIRPRHRQLLITANDPAHLLDQLANEEIPESLVKWNSD
ncbi:TIGR00730 family Rossman fold protein [Chloroflexi bacterium TSY]|nr:TIGR00730 family Rossman fold protein [Chloroflexi bacterium TSY]